jgi:preprotein translocase subunit SecF
MFIVKYRKIFYTLSIILLVASIGSIFFWGLKPGIDFTGGSLLDVSFSGDSPSSSQVKNVLNGLGFSDASVRQSGEGFFITLKQINPIQKETIIKALTIDGVYSPIEKTFSSVGPVLGKESLQKSWFSIVLVLLAIVLFVAFAFRKVSEPLSSWVYGIVTILALMHDVLVPTGVFAILGHLKIYF